MKLSARQIVLSGQVQGVGFRPFIYRLAAQHDLVGWVKNCVGTVEIFIQGETASLENFLSDIFIKKPPIAEPVLLSDTQAELDDYDVFSILDSDHQGASQISVPADLFLCDDCLNELNDPADRRYRYPFINCTQCGPRYTLIKKLPYDRINTTMADFQLCSQCLSEYENPLDRRFHAEPVACPVCGPSLSFVKDDFYTKDNDEAIRKTVEALHQGLVVAVKGIGGYHLICDARNAQAVARLRANKPRPDKPLAVLFPAPVDDPFKVAEQHLKLNENDKTFLLKPARAILLVEKNSESGLSSTQLSEQVAPGLNEIGLMLPYSPLHHLILNDFSGPVIATSANISGEPVLTENEQVEKRLSHVADACLHHDREIERPADDPVYRTIAGKIRPIRTGRGTAPIEFTLPFKLARPTLAVGAHMKNVIALAWDSRIVVSPHIGEMDTARSLEIFCNTIADLQKLYDVTAQQIICDAHPAYTTTRWANKQGLPVHSVFHHHAHASAAYYECQAEIKAGKAVIAFTWDGVGYGEDKTLWGGEAFVGSPGQWKRAASMRPFNLPGADKAGRQPWRSAAALCWHTEENYEALPEIDPLLKLAWQKKINAPQTTSVGRLFDAAAALTGICTQASFEGQGPMQLESLCDDSDEFIALPQTEKKALLLCDWQPLIAVMQDKTIDLARRASIFHNSLAQALLQQAEFIRKKHSVDTVCFSGGVFQNRVLAERAIVLLKATGFEVCLPELTPVNDAGISFGQVMEYGYKNKN